MMFCKGDAERRPLCTPLALVSDGRGVVVFRYGRSSGLRYEGAFVNFTLLVRRTGRRRGLPLIQAPFDKLRSSYSV